MKVYVRWYGKVVEGELLDGEYLGMKLVRIPLDGHHPVAMFTPQHVYNSEAEARDGEHHKKMEDYLASTTIPRHQQQRSPFKAPVNLNNEALIGWIRCKAEHWDYEHNHLKTEYLEEFYQLWRDAHSATPIPIDSPLNPYYKNGSTTEPKARCRQCANLDYDHLSDRKDQVAPDEHFCGLHGRTRVDPDGQQPDLNHKGGCGFIQKPQPRKPTKKELRSSGEIEFQDATQLALF